MDDVGVIALDPVRLSGLEVYLQGLVDGCRGRAGRVADEVAGSGVPADHPIGELERLAAVCHRERDEVTWRRAMVEQLPGDLPLPARIYAGAGSAAQAGRGLAQEVADAVSEQPPRWARLERLLAELDRSARSGPFTVAFLTALGPRAVRALPLLLERAWWDGRARRAGPVAVGEPTEDERAEVTVAEVRLAAAIRTASQVEGDAGLDATWSRVYAGVPSDDEAFATAEAAATPAQREEADRVRLGLQAAGYGGRMAASVAAKVGWSQVAGVLSTGTGLMRVVVALGALDDGDGVACDVPQAGFGVAAGVVLVLAPASVPVMAAVGALSAASALFSVCRRQEPRTAETTPTADPATGTTRLPSGHASNPHVDTAGVPLPPAYG